MFDIHKAIVKTFHFRGHFRSLQVIIGHKKGKLWIRCCSCIPWVPNFRLICIKPQLKHFSFLEVIQVIKGRKRSLEGQTLDLLLLVYSWGSQLSFDMHQAIVKTFSFLEVIQAIRGRKRSLEGQTLDLLLLLYSLGSQLQFDMH